MKYVLLCALLLTTAGLLGVSLPVFAQADPLLDGDAALDQMDQSEAFLSASGLQPVHPAIIVANIIRVVLGLLGVIFLVLVLYAGFRWMASAGNEDQIGKAKKTLAAAIIGLVIVLSAFLITAFVISQITDATVDYF